MVYRKVCCEVQFRLHQMKDLCWFTNSDEFGAYADEHHMHFYAGFKAVYEPMWDFMMLVKSRGSNRVLTVCEGKSTCEVLSPTVSRVS